VRPNHRAKVEQKQFDQRRNHTCRERDGFNEGDSVHVKNYSARGDKWLKGLVVEKGGPVSYKVSLGENVIVKRHIDQMKKCESSIEMPGESEISSEMSIEPSLIGDKSVEISPELECVFPERGEGSEVSEVNVREESSQSYSANSIENRKQETPKTPRPVRERKTPARFKDYV